MHGSITGGASADGRRRRTPDELPASLPDPGSVLNGLCIPLRLTFVQCHRQPARRPPVPQSSLAVLKVSLVRQSIRIDARPARAAPDELVSRAVKVR
jgi:hypothetical protein